MSSPSRIIVLGSINADMVIRSSRLPGPGETVIGGEFYQAPGGKGANQAVAAARAALAPVTFIGAVGDDHLGHEALDRFKTENLNCDWIKTIPGESSGIALILVDENGQNLISVASGANARLRPEDIDALPNAVFAQAKVFLTCLETPLATVARGLARAKRAGLITLLNPAPASREMIDAGLLALVDVLTPNAGEAELLTACGVADACTGRASGTQHSMLEGDSFGAHAAVQLQRLGCRSVVVTLGSEGCLVVDQEVTRIPSCPVRAVDATAAGDAFNGALAVAMSEGRSLLDGAKWANAAAAISVTRRGAQPSLPSRTEIDSFQ